MEKKIAHPSNRDGLLFRSLSRSAATTSSDFVLQWGNRKRLRCMKVHGKDNKRIKNPIPNPSTITNGYLNLRHRSASPSRRILRNSESPIGMRGSSNGVRGLASLDRGERKGTSNANSHHHGNKNNNHNNDNHHGSGSGGSGSSETGTTGGEATIATVWPPKFVIALTNKEKEEDFLAIKGSKLPQRPKKRAKSIQRTLNLVSPGAWLCDLTLERYEVREKKVSKKRPKGLRAMGNNMGSDSE